MLVNKHDGDYKLRSQLHQPPRPELAQLYSLKYSELQFSQSLSLILNCTSHHFSREISPQNVTADAALSTNTTIGIYLT